MINWSLLTPRNLIVVAAIAIAWHAVLSPVFGSIAKRTGNDQTPE